MRDITIKSDFNGLLTSLSLFVVQFAAHYPAKFVLNRKLREDPLLLIV